MTIQWMPERIVAGNVVATVNYDTVATSPFCQIEKRWLFLEQRFPHISACNKTLLLPPREV